MDVQSARLYAILLVKDQGGAIASTIAEEGFRVTCCEAFEDAWHELARREYAVVIVDRDGVAERGVQFLRQLARVQPRSSRVLMTDAQVSDELIGAVKSGEILRVLTNPFVRSDVIMTLDNAVERYALLRRSLQFYPELGGAGCDLVWDNDSDGGKPSESSQLKRGHEGGGDALRDNLEHNVGLCFRLISAFYPLIGRQTQSVVEICRAMAVAESFTEVERRVLYLSSWLYDIGIMALSRPMLHRLLACPEACSPEEISLFRHHPIMGQTLASFVDRMPAVGVTIRAHHERFDGTGYPDGLAGEAISWTARCLAVAVAFVQTGLPKERAAAYLLEQSGMGFDPEAVRLFFKTNQIEDLPRNVREILLSELSPGMQLARGIHTSSGILLLPEGQMLNEIALQKIQNHSRHHLVTERILVYG